MIIIIGWIGWAVTAILAAHWIYGIRKYAANGARVSLGNTLVGLLFVLLTIAPFARPFQKIHLLWLTPVAWAVGTFLSLSVTSLVAPFAQAFFFLCTIGIDQKRAAAKRAWVEARAAELRASGLQPLDALAQAEAEAGLGGWAAR